MQIYTTQDQSKNIFDSLGSLKNTAVALGCFDAIHIGHRQIIKNTIDYAKKNNLTSVVYMFRNNPSSVISADGVKSINTFKQRLEIIESLGAGIVIAQWFTPEFREVSPEDFVRLYLKERLDAKYISAGFNYRFGKIGRGDAALLSELGKQYGIKFCPVPCVELGGTPVSSTRIRKLIQDGDMETAAACLGRQFSYRGTVIQGNRIGRTFGFPTANLSFSDSVVMPKQGVYITKTLADGILYPSITNVGIRPTVEKGLPFVETYIAGYSGDLYGKEIEIEFYTYRRSIVKFPDTDCLKAQLSEDKAALSEYFK